MINSRYVNAPIIKYAGFPLLPFGKKSRTTQKPLSILKKIIEISSNKEDTVLDCFMGVGSTAVACKETGRKFIGCELDERYIGFANQRII